MRLATRATSTVRALIEDATIRLANGGVQRARLEASILLREVLSTTQTSLLAHPDWPVTEAEQHQFHHVVARRAAREPLAYVVGWREFFGRRFLADRRALIPRPESELLVELACDWRPAERAGARIVDVGSGSGCLAVTLALELPRASVLAADISPAALELTGDNARLHRVDGRVQRVHGDLLGWCLGPVDVVVANLPYVPEETLADLQPEVRLFEPRLALDGGADGSALIRKLLAQLAEQDVGMALLEVDTRHAEHVLHIATASFPQRPVRLIDDLSGRPRILQIGPKR